MGASPRGRAQLGAGFRRPHPRPRPRAPPTHPAGTEPTARHSHRPWRRESGGARGFCCRCFCSCCAVRGRGVRLRDASTPSGATGTRGLRLPAPAPGRAFALHGSRPARRARLRRGEGRPRRRPQPPLEGPVRSPRRSRRRPTGAGKGGAGVLQDLPGRLLAAAMSLESPPEGWGRPAVATPSEQRRSAAASLLGSELPVLGLSRAHHSQGVGERNPDPVGLVPSPEDSPSVCARDREGAAL